MVDGNLCVPRSASARTTYGEHRVAGERNAVSQRVGGRRDSRVRLQPIKRARQRFKCTQTSSASVLCSSIVVTSPIRGCRVLGDDCILEGKKRIFKATALRSKFEQFPGILSWVGVETASICSVLYTVGRCNQIDASTTYLVSSCVGGSGKMNVPVCSGHGVSQQEGYAPAQALNIMGDSFFRYFRILIPFIEGIAIGCNISMWSQG